MNLLSLTFAEFERVVKAFSFITIVLSLIIFIIRMSIETKPFSIVFIWQAAASAVTISTICFGIFAKKTWNSAWLAKWFGKPTVHGLWQGTLKSSYEQSSHGPIDIIFVIKQTYMSLSIESFTMNQEGESKIEALIQNPKTATARVCYIFELRRTYKGENKLTIGSGDLKLIDGGKKLKGSYWTNAPTHGDVELSLVSRDCSNIDCFETAKAKISE